jgi:hypothetical protein
MSPASTLPGSREHVGDLFGAQRRLLSNLSRTNDRIAIPVAGTIINFGHSAVSMRPNERHRAPLHHSKVFDCGDAIVGTNAMANARARFGQRQIRRRGGRPNANQGRQEQSGRKFLHTRLQSGSGIDCQLCAFVMGLVQWGCRKPVATP